jgi:tetratricopeptide (TPR) repeat protein
MTAALALRAAPAAPPPAPPVADPAVELLARWRAAFPALDALIASGAAPGAALRRLGLTFWTAGQTAAAAEALDQAAVWSPGDAAVWLDLGFARRASQNPAGAVEAFERATRLAPQNARGWLALGLAARESGAPQRAEPALEKALALDPGCDEAAYALGLIAFDARRYAEAARHWRGVVARGFSAPGLWLGLGQCQFFLGEFAAAAVSLARHLETAPGDAAIARRLALVAFLDAAIRGGPQAGRAAYEARPGAGAPFADIVKTAVQLLSAYGYISTARDVAAAYLGEGDDPIERHHLAALTGEKLTRAPAEYVAAYFDRFADTFDDQLYGVLQYRGPQKL